MTHQRPYAANRAGWWFLLTAAFAGMSLVWAALLNQYWLSRDAYTACAANPPPGAQLIGDTLSVTIDRTFFPAGRQCLYDMQDGSVTIIQTGWPISIWALIGTAICLLIVVITWIVRRRMSIMQRLLAHVALLFTALGWASIALFAGLG